MNQKLAYVLFAFAFIVAIVVGFETREDLRPRPAEFRAKFQETVLRPRGNVIPAVRDLPARDPASSPALPVDQTRGKTSGPTQERDPLTRPAFAARYGEALKWTFYEGRVIRIDGSGIPSEKYSTDQKLDRFRPSNDAEVAARARGVFVNARRLLGIPDRADFLPGAVTPGESSAQVIYHQSFNGVPVTPGGTVTVLLGPEGEVRGIDSSIYPETEIVNAPGGQPPANGREVLFVVSSAPTAVLHYAYETRSQGIQTVVDAQTGAILLQRNRRIH